METNIVVMFHPFTKAQDVHIYQNGKCIKTLHPYLNDVVNVVNSLKSEYNISKVNLCGNTSFVSKFAKQLATNFNSTQIEIIEY